MPDGKGEPGGGGMKLDEFNDAIRAENVTASECGALLDWHPYSSPLKIWDRLVSPFPMEYLTSEAMETGSFMEAAILRLAEKRLGFKSRQNGRTFQHPKVRLCATPDAFVLGQPPGLVEIKLSGRPELWRSVPPHVEWQVRAQMACTGRATAAVCVLVGAGLRTFLLEREADKEDQLLAAVDRFWNEYVLPLKRPEPAVPDAELRMEIPL
jgi:predicted phage-related endonuclease